jgi:hypothetical protein
LAAAEVVVLAMLVVAVLVVSAQLQDSLLLRAQHTLFLWALAVMAALVALQP